MQLQKWFIIIGCVLIVIGFCLSWLLKSGVGRLPGDIYIKKDHFTFYFPIVTCLILSIIISVAFWLFNR